MDNLALFILFAFIAEVLGTVGGFGSSVFFVPIAAYFLDFHSVLGITALFHVSSNITKIGFFRKGVDRKLILTLGIPAILFVIVGAYFSKFLASAWLEAVLSVFLIGMSLAFLIFRNMKLEPTTTLSVAGGVLSGFIAGLLGTGGAIRGMTLSSFRLSSAVFIATSAVIDLGIDFSRSVVYALNGFIRYSELYLIPILLIVSILGTWAGKAIINRITEERFRDGVLVLVLITGLLTLGRTLFG